LLASRIGRVCVPLVGFSLGLEGERRRVRRRSRRVAAFEVGWRVGLWVGARMRGSCGVVVCSRFQGREPARLFAERARRLARDRCQPSGLCWLGAAGCVTWFLGVGLAVVEAQSYHVPSVRRIATSSARVADRNWACLPWHQASARRDIGNALDADLGVSHPLCSACRSLFGVVARATRPVGLRCGEGSCNPLVDLL